MKTMLIGAMLAVVMAFSGGCEKVTEVKRETTVTTPNGTTTKTETETLEQTGDNPPPVSK